MKNTKRMISAALALVFCLMLMPAGIVNAAEVQTGGYENGNGLDLNKIGSYISGISNPDGGVAEIVSYDVVENKAWVVNGATGMLDILDLIEDGAYSSNTYPDAVAAYMPDGISMYESNGKTYLVTANEGDAREWGDEESGTEFCNEIKETLIASDGTEAKKVRVIDPKVSDGNAKRKTDDFDGKRYRHRNPG